MSSEHPNGCYPYCEPPSEEKRDLKLSSSAERTCSAPSHDETMIFLKYIPKGSNRKFIGVLIEADFQMLTLIVRFVVPVQTLNRGTGKTREKFYALIIVVPIVKKVV